MRSPGTFRDGPGDVVARAAALADAVRQRQAVFWLALIFGPFLVGYVLAALVLFPAPIFATSRFVPSVMGLPLSEAQTVLENAGLEPGDAETVSHPSAPRGTVVWQAPPPDVAVPEGTAIALSVSGGPQRVPVPDLTGYDAPLARDLLEAAGLAIGRVDSTQAPVPKGVVVNSRPPAGTPLMPGSDVTLVVSIGAPTISVPNLLGLTVEEAQVILEDASLVLGPSVTRSSMSGAPGTIIQQNPGANTLAAPGTAVDVVVARGRQ
jgi:beta-lactam-binding protein with PASTA domain